MANSQSGKNKAFQISYDQIAALDAECRTVTLTRQQIYSLLVQSAYIGWRTRWEGAPLNFPVDEFQAGVQAALMNDCDCWDCDDVAECIETSENVRNALLRLVSNSQDAPGSPQTSQSANEDRAVGLNPTCDQDVLFGQCLAVVDMVHTSITDILELVEAQNNFIEVANVVANLPGLDELGADALTEAVDLLFEAIGESYQAQYTIERRLTLACDIYCQCKVDCQISTERVWAGYQAAVARDFPNPFSFDTFMAVLDFLVDAEIDQANVVTAMHAMFWGGVRLISEMIGVGSIDRVMRLALSFAEPNNLWADCECAVIGFQVRGQVGVTEVTQVGNVYTIRYGYAGPLSRHFLYVEPVGVTALSYDAMAFTNFQFYDWSDGSPQTSVPPGSAPPPDVVYAGGARSGGNDLTIVFETTMQFLGIVQGS